MTMQADAGETDTFAGSRERFEAMLAWLGDEEATGLSHAELEARLELDGRELLRQLFQDHLDVRAQHETRLEAVVDADRVPPTSVEAGHQRALATVFGEVQVKRLAYRKREHANLHPADGVLNLPEETHSHGLRRIATIQSTRGSFDGAVEAVERVTGQRLGKRQVEDLAQRAACDFDEFYASRPRPAGESGDVLVCPVTARASSCAPRPCVPRPSRPRPGPPPSSRPVCPKARSATASAWPRSAASMTPLPSPVPRRHPGHHRR